ncbi:MAG: hypothetical protein H6735_12760 [Alphaproteobacteria bacterium]|nr:hypothetical protein [Alphaproteobacteria bacterium]
MIALLLGAAVAQTVTGAAVVGPLRPGSAVELQVAVEGGAAPRLDLEGGTVLRMERARPGVWSAVLVPSVESDRLSLRTAAGMLEWPIEPPAAGDLVLPDPVDAVAGTETVRFLVGGDPGLRASDLVVATGEGTVLGLRDVEGGVEVSIAPDDLPYPRFVPVGVWDRRRDRRPTWTRIRLHARPRIPLQAEPGAQLSLRIGSRTYGPFEASASGAIDARVDQYPGEVAATAVLTDDLGNETRTEIALLAGADPLLVAVSDGEVLPGRAAPALHLRGLTPTGEPSRDAPTCGAPFGELSVVADGPGEWFVPIPALEPPQDVHVVCVLGPTRIRRRVPVAAGVPARLALRVWPQDLRADFPWSEIRVTMEDWRGERLPVEDVVVTAGSGTVTMDDPGGIVLRGDYDGGAAAQAGEDRLHARYFAPPGGGPPTEIVFGWEAVPLRGSFQLFARALDADRRPVSVPLRLGIGQASQDVTTGSDGWAKVEVAVPGGGVPMVAVAEVGGVTHRALVLPGEAASRGPGSPDLEASSAITVRPGRASGLDIEVEPAILRAGPGAVAWIYVRLEDGAGQPITDEPVELVATEGQVGEAHTRPDGTLVAEYTPLPVESSRQVEITASTPTMHSTTRLLLEPRVVRMSLGPWVGVSSNFGPDFRPLLGVDLDVRTRTRFAGEALMVRASLSASAFSSTASTGVGPDLELRSTVVPFGLALLLRQDMGPWSLWGGLGGAVGVHHQEVRFGGELVSTGEIPVFGPELHGAVARRVPGGELAAGLRGTWIPVSSQDVGYTGNLGGVAATLGYRLVW